MTHDRLNLCPACRKDWKLKQNEVCQSCRDSGRRDPNRATVTSVLFWFAMAVVVALCCAWAAHQFGWFR